MSAQAGGPGKTAPKLIHDFLTFDPVKSGQGNILADHPPPYGDGPVPTTHRDSCKHDYTSKLEQSVTPPLDERPDDTSQYKLALLCKKCRIHADIRIDYRFSTEPCPTSEAQLHHFRRLHAIDQTASSHITYGWQCSSATCLAICTITYKVPRVSDDNRLRITNTELLKRRYEEVVRRDPERDGIKQATPLEATNRLRKYIVDALDPEHTRRSFPANNKRFMEAFGWLGEDCKEMLEEFGFKYASQDLMWALPQPPQLANRLESDGSNLRELLEDVKYELLAIMYKLATQTGGVNPAAQEGWASAVRDFERTLAAQGYSRHPALRRTANSASEGDAYFASLGALPDFSDSLIAFSYDRQALCDVEQQSYYFECLRGIAISRSSDDLQVKATMLESSGVVSRKDLHEAYSYFNLPQGGGGAEDDRILNIFQAQQSDIGPAAAERAREMLYRIGNSRGSKLLINAAQQSIETEEEAYSWLGNGVDKHTMDDLLTTVFALRTEGDPAKEEIGRKAITVIAEARNSSALKSWLETGTLHGYTMSADEALRILGIDSSLGDIDANIWPTIFETAQSDRPGEQTTKAIDTIQQALAGRTNVSTSAPTHPPETWPVGLISHGNTCYLNSLLQYYFSIKPLRDMVLDYDQFKLDTSTVLTKKERVGHRSVTTVEIKNGQKFADDLKHLFVRMVKESGSAVKPEQDLVCRAFLDLDDLDLLGTKTPQEPSADDGVIRDEAATNGSHDGKERDNLSIASSATLQASESEDKDIAMGSGELPPTPPASPGQKPVDEKVHNPPPLPPRRFSTTTRATLEKAQYNATQQQDVTEVHDGIMFRLRAGMRPNGMDELGEQQDGLRDLFAVRLHQVEVKDGVLSKPTVHNDLAIQLNVPTEPTDIYTALDAYFDQQAVQEGVEIEQYKSFSFAPPLLQINIPRIGYDRTKGAFKSETSIKLEDELFLDRYSESNDPAVLEKRRSAWVRRKRLQALQKEKKILQSTPLPGLDGPSAVDETAKYISQLSSINDDLLTLGTTPLEIDPDLPMNLSTESTRQSHRLTALDSEISLLQSQLSAQFAGLNNLRYRLQAVFFHRGASSHGHYWLFIHDFANDVWRKYNDEKVDEVPAGKLVEEIFHAEGWNAGTPTLAVYVRDDLKGDYVQPVCRRVDPPEVPEDVKDLDVSEGTKEGAKEAVDGLDVDMSGTAQAEEVSGTAGLKAGDQVVDMA